MSERAVVSEPKCEGLCDPSECGTPKRVQIIGERGKDWGEFWYCDSAIEFDRDRGFRVEVLPADQGGA